MLTTRAQKYINGLSRAAEWTCERDAVIYYFEKQGFPVFEPFVRFQTDYSGLLMNPGPVRLNLFSQEMMRDNTELDYWLDDDNAYCLACGQYEDVAAPFDFGITQTGEIISLGGEERVILYSSAEKMIEGKALHAEQLARKERGFGYSNVPDIDSLLTFLREDGFERIDECSDRYSIWLTNRDMTVHCGTWMHTQAFFIDVFAHSAERCENYLNRLSVKDLVSKKRW